MKVREFLSKLACCALLCGIGLGCSREPAQDTSPVPKLVQALETPEEAFPDKPLVVGDRVFDFRAIAHNGAAVKLSDFNESPTLVYFCDDVQLPICEATTLGLRDGWLALQTQISMALVIASEDIVHLRDYASKKKLPLLLLSDKDGKLKRLFGLGAGASSSYLVSTEREVLHVFAAPSGRGHGQEVVNQIHQLGLLKEAYPP